MVIRIYRMTICTVWYDENTHNTREFEMHYKVARLGNIRNIRLYLARRGANYFQHRLYYLYKQWISKDKIRISFEREERTKHSDDYIRIEIRRMEGIGKRKRWKAYGDMPRKISYYKKPRHLKL